MPFKVVEIPLSPAGDARYQIEWGATYATREAAASAIEKASGSEDMWGYDPEHGYWWTRSSSGEVRRFLIQ
jgi:hypothetical protein